ncbi:MAG: C-terminal binding protein [Deltaproteobacteria bacterium]|jgi:D-3-phosphoglycerate dehydrogenase|nr:C-terminal binding protein [Deltaproteobacteria bacterium]
MPEKRFTVIITENDHGFITPEEAVFQGTECELILMQLHDEQSIIEACADADALICQYARITPTVIPHLKRCRIVSRYGVGYDTIDIPAATAAGIMVANVPDYGIEEVALQALSLALQMYRGTHICDRSVHAGEWEYRVAGEFREALNTTVGVYGAGRIGNSFAAKAHALGFTVIVCDRLADRIPSFARAVDHDTLLRESDIISVHCDLNEQTRHIFNDEAFARMKRDVIFVNTSRGAVVDEAALVRALRAGHFRGVGLDVLEKEPPLPGSELLGFANVILTPHIAWYSLESRLRLKRRAAETALMTLRGAVSPYLVNPDVLHSPKLRFERQ